MRKPASLAVLIGLLLLRRVRFLSFSLLGLICIVFVLGSDFYFSWLPSRQPTATYIFEFKATTPKELYTSQACIIPEVNPYHKSFLHMIQPSKLTSNCSNFTRTHTFPLLFNSSVDSNLLIPVISMEKFHLLKIKSCCYRYGLGIRGDENFVLSEMCYPVSLENATMIPKEHEFIAILCKNQESLAPAAVPVKVSPKNDSEFRCVDVHAFVPMKAEVMKRLVSVGQQQSGQRPSVAIFGLDAVSRANVLRMMPKTHKYLVEVMGAVDMEGYNKVGDHSLSNLAKLMTSRSMENLSATCAKNMFYDECPLIWKDFAKVGYVTAFAEDHILGIFSLIDLKSKGFVTQPTDYYFRAFNRMFHHYFHGLQPGKHCLGPRLYYTALLDYLEKFMVTMKRESKPFFFFMWQASLTHDDLNDAQLADEPTLRSLKWMHENKMLDNTIFILMGDHGQRVGEVMKYRQGHLEDRLPPLYFVFPEWFKEKYGRAFSNVQGNVRRFTNSLDVYYTLQDIVNIGHLEDEVLIKREEELKSQFRNENITGVPPPTGISMFLPMPLERTCRHTSIEPGYCICTLTAPVDVHEDKDLINATRFALKEINKEIESNKRCAALILHNITSAQWNLNLSEETTYEIHFETKFGGNNVAGNKGIFPEFHAKVQRDRESSSLWKMVGNVTMYVRETMYGNFSGCMPNPKGHPYCFCK